MTNRNKINQMTDVELASYGMYVKYEKDYDEDIDGVWVEIGKYSVYVSIFDNFESEDIETVFAHNLKWLRREVK